MIARHSFLISLDNWAKSHAKKCIQKLFTTDVRRGVQEILKKYGAWTAQI